MRSSAKLGEKSLPELASVFVKECLVEAIQRSNGSLDAAAKLLKLSRDELDTKLKDLGVDTAPASGEKVAWKSVET